MFNYQKFSTLLNQKKLTIVEIVEEVEKLQIRTSESSVKGYKTGKHCPRLEILCAFSKILEVEISELIKC